jgi:hypothetical protein
MCTPWRGPGTATRGPGCTCSTWGAVRPLRGCYPAGLVQPHQLRRHGRANAPQSTTHPGWVLTVREAKRTHVCPPRCDPWFGTSSSSCCHVWAPQGLRRRGSRPPQSSPSRCPGAAQDAAARWAYPLDARQNVLVHLGRGQDGERAGCRPGQWLLGVGEELAIDHVLTIHQRRRVRHYRLRDPRLRGEGLGRRTVAGGRRAHGAVCWGGGLGTASVRLGADGGRMLPQTACPGGESPLPSLECVALRTYRSPDQNSCWNAVERMRFTTRSEVFVIV